MAVWLTRIGDCMAIGFEWFYKGLGILWALSLVAIGLAWLAARKKGA